MQSWSHHIFPIK